MTEEEDKDKCYRVDGNGHVLLHPIRVTQLADERRYEILDRLGTGCQHEHNDKDVRAPVRHDHLERMAVRGVLRFVREQRAE